MENFYLKLHKGSKKPFYKDNGFFKDGEFLKEKTKKKDFFCKITKEFNDKNEYLSPVLKNLLLRQLLHGKTLCEDFPSHFVFTTNENNVTTKRNELKKDFAGVNDFETDGKLAIGLGSTSVCM